MKIPRAWIKGYCPNIILNVNGVKTRLGLLAPYLNESKSLLFNNLQNMATVFFNTKKCG